MITVTISINDRVILACSAVNIGPSYLQPDKTIYEIDDGSRILHVREDGGAALAIKMLKTIKEPGL